MQARQTRKVWPVVFLVLLGLLVTFSLAAAQMNTGDRGKIESNIGSRTSGGGDPDNPVPFLGQNGGSDSESMESQGRRNDVARQSELSAAWNRFLIVVDTVRGMTAPILVL